MASGQLFRTDKRAHKDERWIGVDLDGTLAHYDGFKGPTVIGAPIPAMVERVKRWLAQGKQVKIFTARVYAKENEDPKQAEEARAAIEKWSKQHLGRVLPVTYKKDRNMVRLYDDRARQVQFNTGKLFRQGA